MCRNLNFRYVNLIEKGVILKEVNLKKSITMQMELQLHIPSKIYVQQNIPSELTEKK